LAQQSDETKWLPERNENFGICCFSGNLGRTESLMLPVLLAQTMLLTFQELSMKD